MVQLNNANEQIAHANEQIANLQETNNEQLVQLNNANEQIAHANQQLANQGNMIQQLQDTTTNFQQQIHNEINRFAVFIEQQYTQMNVTTNTRSEIIDIWTNKSLTNHYREQHLCAPNEKILDTYCGDAGHRERVQNHLHGPNTDEDEPDRLIKACPNANAIDLFRYIDEHRQRYPHVRTYNRKIIYPQGYRHEVIALLNEFEHVSANGITELTNRMRQQAEIMNANIIAHVEHIIQQHHDEMVAMVHQQEQQHHEEQMAAIAEVAQQQELAQQQHVQQQQDMQQQLQHLAEQEQQHHEEQMAAIAEVQEQVLTMVQQLAARYPEATEIWFNRFYRRLHREPNGTVWCEVRKGSNERHQLDDYDLNNRKFR